LVVAIPVSAQSLDGREARDFARRYVEAVVESATGLPSELTIPGGELATQAAYVEGASWSSIGEAADWLASRGRATPIEEFTTLRRFAEEFREGREVFGVTVAGFCLIPVEPTAFATHEFDITYTVEYSGGDAFSYRMRMSAAWAGGKLRAGSRPGGAEVDLVDGFQGCTESAPPVRRS